MYRDSGPAVSVSRSAQLEHRAYLLLMAARAGVPVSDVVIAVRGGSQDMAVLALLEPVGEPLSTIVPGAITDATLDDVWTKAARLHASRLTHGQLVPANVIVDDDGSVALVDFSQGSAGAPPERCERDLADLLSTTSALVGIERALDAAMRSLGRDRLEELLPLLETPALSPAARRAVPGSKKHLKALREAGAERCGIEVPDLTELRRVSPGSIVMAAATFLGFYLIVAQFAGVDLWATLSEADWSWVTVAFALSFIPQFSGAIALMGCVSHPLPFRPVLAEQFANNFTGLIGGTVATTALVIRFFQKQGLKVAVAVSSGVMNSLAGSIVQLVLVTIGLIFTSTQFVPSSVGGGDLEQIILIGIVVLGVAVTIAMLVPRLRAALRRVIAPQYASARDNVRGILQDPRRAAMIFGGNLCSQVTYALVIDAALHAYGASLPLLQIIVINSLASLLGGMAPVPGRHGRHRGGADRRHDGRRHRAGDRRRRHLHRPSLHRLPATDLGMGLAAVAAPPRLRVVPASSAADVPTGGSVWCATMTSCVDPPFGAAGDGRRCGVAAGGCSSAWSSRRGVVATRSATTPSSTSIPTWPAYSRWRRPCRHRDSGRAAMSRHSMVGSNGRSRTRSPKCSTSVWTSSKSRSIRSFR